MATARIEIPREKIADFCQRHHIRKLSLFGSVVRDDFGPNSDIDVLVATTVIEVGIDVPNATIMLIEHAERFGLAQLHQLRGRVGRGTAESYCVLVSDTTDPVAKARLAAVQELRDGFALAERDWELRREGNVLGLVQSGLPQLRVASLQRERHRELAVAAREVVERLLDPVLLGDLAVTAVAGRHRGLGEQP